MAAQDRPSTAAARDPNQPTAYPDPTAATRPAARPEPTALAQPTPRRAPQMLPGIAMICLFLIISTILNVYAALTGTYGLGRARVGILALCTLLAIGILGLIRLTKWGWALVTAGCLLLATGDLVYFTRTHAAFFLVRGLLTLVFFLYLVRPETRDHLR